MKGTSLSLMNRKELLDPIRWVVLLSLVCGSCGEGTIENNQGVLHLKAEAKGTRLSQVGETTLELPDTGPALGFVFSITVVGDYIVVVDALRWSVEVFDIEGSHKWSIGSRGDGKGQYKKPLELATIPNTDQILVYDAGTGHILRFSLEGKFEGMVQLAERRFIQRMLVSSEHNLIYTYTDKHGNGTLCISSLGTGEDLAKFRISDSRYRDLFSFLGAMLGLSYDEAQGMVYCALPWEERVMRIDLTGRRFLKSITTKQRMFSSVKLYPRKTPRELAKDLKNFSKLIGMHLMSSGDLLLKYQFDDSLQNTALVLLSDPGAHPSAKEVKTELSAAGPFTCRGMSVFVYSYPADGEGTNGKIRIYRLKHD